MGKETEKCLLLTMCLYTCKQTFYILRHEKNKEKTKPSENLYEWMYLFRHRLTKPVHCKEK